jgi:hypothetical protein
MSDFQVSSTDIGVMPGASAVAETKCKKVKTSKRRKFKRLDSVCSTSVKRWTVSNSDCSIVITATQILICACNHSNFLDDEDSETECNSKLA